MLLGDLQLTRGENECGSTSAGIVRMLARKPDDHEYLIDAIDAIGKLDGRSLGNLFRRRRDRVVVCADGVRRVLISAPHRNTQRWLVRVAN